jgi:hypothetical protein
MGIPRVLVLSPSTSWLPLAESAAFAAGLQRLRKKSLSSYFFSTAIPGREEACVAKTRSRRFLRLISCLTGTETKEAPSDIFLLERILSDDNRVVDYNEFNELLLLVKKKSD